MDEGSGPDPTGQLTIRAVPGILKAVSSPPPRLHHSPAAIFAVSLGALVAWSVGYEAWRGPTASAEAPAETAASAGAALANARYHGRRAPVPLPDVRPPARLRAPHPEEGPPGLEIAVDDRDGHSMDAFYAALTRAARREGQAKVLVYGASHTASDLYTGLLRRELQRAYGDAGHGFVLPVAPWPSYRHRGVHIESAGEWTTYKVQQPSGAPDHYGLAGVAVESSSAGAWGLVRTERDGPVGEAVSAFDVFYLEQPGGGDFDVLIDGAEARRVRTAADERRPGYAVFEVPDGPHELKVRVQGNGPVRLFGVALGRATPGVVVDTLGINGSRARSHLYWEDRTYREHLARRDPDLVVLAYGTNESGDEQPMREYMEELDRVLTRIQEAVPEASCLLVGPSDRPVRVNRRSVQDRPRTAAIIDAQWRVALEHGCGFFDTVAFQGGPLSTFAWSSLSPPYAAADLVHFTRLGYERFGQVLLGALVEGFEPPEGAPDLRVLPQVAANSDPSGPSASR